MTENSDTDLIVEFIKIARPSARHLNEFEYKIKKTHSFNCWRVDGEKLVPTEHVGILFDGECYVIQWLFDLQMDNQAAKKMLIYYWAGQNALKSACPLPPEVNIDFPVERLTQWSEISLFFHGFQRKCIMLNGKESDFNFEIPHLFLIRGEDLDEIHLYEVPCDAVSLRSRTSFLLVDSGNSVFLYWHGCHAIEEYKYYIKTCDPQNVLKTWHRNWSHFSTIECQEGHEPEIFKDAVGSFLQNSFSQVPKNWTPKLFYLNNLCGDFASTEVEYPLKQSNKVCPYPFLQSHLYTALQPAFFLLDNYCDIWLWENIPESNTDPKNMQEVSKVFLENYRKEQAKKHKINIKVSIVEAYKEPQMFKQLFPQWKNYDETNI